MRLDPVPVELLRARQQRVAAALGEEVLLLHGAPVLHRSRDTEYPHRPDSDLYWLTGLTAPELVAVVQAVEGEPRLTLFIPPRDPTAELWSGPRMDPSEAEARSGAHQVHPLDELDAHLPGLLDGSRGIHFRLGGHSRVEAQVVEALRRARARGPRKGTGPRRVTDPGEILDDLRLVKDAWELERMREAARITVAAFRAARSALGPGVPEWKLQAVLESVFRGEGGDGPAYETIVGSGPNACVLHYVANERVAGMGELVLVDAGAAVGLYAADITRTWPVSGRFTQPQRDLYRVVEEARAAAAATVRPGATVGEVHDAAVRTLTAGLVELGVLEGEVAALVEEDAFKPFYPHQTSHWLGLDVHDVGDYARVGASRVLEPGMVLTVEPGLYFGPGGMEAAGERAAPYQGVGIRVEDDLLVTEDGHENLTGALPTAVEAVEG